MTPHVARFAEGAGGDRSSPEAGGAARAEGRHERREGADRRRAAEGAHALPGAHLRVPAAAQHDAQVLREPAAGQSVP